MSLLLFSYERCIRDRVNPIPIKAAMNLMGMEAGSLRLPLCDISRKKLELSLIHI